MSPDPLKKSPPPPTTQALRDAGPNSTHASVDPTLISDVVETRLGIRCPHCQRLSEATDETLLSEMVCTACQKTFRLVDDTPAAEGQPRTFGHFQLIEQIGAGSFGAVWKAQDAELGRTVAIKIPRKQRLTPREASEFLRDARAAAQLRHPNIVNIYEVGQQDNTVYIVSELIPGTTLALRLEAGPWLPREAAKLCVKLAEALQHAHELGVIHRDLKPSNIMLDPRSEPYLIDFGLAKREATDVTLTLEGKILGTPAYMSPEQARGAGHQTDRRTDLYSLGVILFELLTGERPFRGNLRMLLEQVLNDDPPSPRKLAGSIPRDLETICLKSLQKSPDRRYQTAAELAADLRRWLNSEPILARPVGPVERGWRWCQRNPVLAGLGAAVSLLLVLVAAGSTIAAANLARAQGKTEDALQRAKVEGTRAVASNQTALEQLYVNRIALAQREWLANHPQQAEQLLDDCPEQLRRWEWFYLKRLCHSAEATLRGHVGAVTAIAYHPDGARLATGGEDMTIRIWDAVTGAELQTLDAHEWAVTGLAFAPDGTRLASASSDKTVKLWTLSTGEVSHSLEHLEPVTSVAWSSTGKVLAAGTGDAKRGTGSVKFWDAETGQALDAFQAAAPVAAVAFDPRNPELVGLAQGSEAILWDRAAQSLRLSVKEKGGAIQAIALSPDGASLATAAADGTVRIRAAATGEEHQAFPGSPQSEVASLCFAPQGHRLASAGRDGIVKIWDLETGRGWLTLRGHGAALHGVAFSPDGRRLASASADGTARIWDAALGQEPRWRAEQGGVIRSVAFHPQSKFLASAGNSPLVKLWNPATGAAAGTLAGHTEAVFTLALRPDGLQIASAGADATIRLWDAVTQQPQFVLTGHLNDVVHVAYSHDGKWLASGSTDKTIRIWETASGKETARLAGHLREVTQVAFSPDGRQLASSSRDGTVRVWDVAAARELQMILGHIGPVFCVAFSSDGRELASGGADMQIRVWDAKQGKERRVLRGHKGLVWNLAFSPNGARLASLSWDHNLRIWDAQSGQEILAFYEPTGEFRGLSFSGDGRYLAAGGNDDTVRIWDAGPLETRHGSAAKIAPPISIQQKSAASGETGEAP